MTQYITHFCQFADEPAAKAALPTYWGASIDDGSWSWNRSVVDGPIPVVDGSGNPVAGYFLNVALPALDASLPGIVGAGYGPPDKFTLVYGKSPVTPQRVFA